MRGGIQNSAVFITEHQPLRRNSTQRDIASRDQHMSAAPGADVSAGSADRSVWSRRSDFLFDRSKIPSSSLDVLPAAHHFFKNRNTAHAAALQGKFSASESAVQNPALSNAGLQGPT